MGTAAFVVRLGLALVVVGAPLSRGIGGSVASSAVTAAADVRERPGRSVAAGPAYRTYAWPVDGPVLRPFEPPQGPFGAGHRGIDIGSPIGTTVRAPADGVVAFAGRVAGSLYVSVDHPDGVRTTYSWLSSTAVRAGDHVLRGDPLGATGPGHPGVAPPHLHFGARYAGTYVDPILLLDRGSVVGLIHLAPVEEVQPGGIASSSP
jgi:murein DD-endopeptidase MepM/ murein hydrolase activator NlpD